MPKIDELKNACQEYLKAEVMAVRSLQELVEAIVAGYESSLGLPSKKWLDPERGQISYVRVGVMNGEEFKDVNPLRLDTFYNQGMLEVPFVICTTIAPDSRAYSAQNVVTELLLTKIEGGFKLAMTAENPVLVFKFQALSDCANDIYETISDRILKVFDTSRFA